MGSGWQKFAILGSTYARALGNAAQRSGRNMSAMQPALSNVAQQPLAKLKPGLSSFVREPGTVAPTPQQQSVQQLLHKTPWATDEHTGLRGGSEHAVNTYNNLLQESGRAHSTPAGQPTTHERIQQSFGAPKPQMKDPSQVRPMPANAYKLPGGFTAPVGRNIFELMDEPMHGGTRVGPAPMPAMPRPAVHTPASTASTAVLRKTAGPLATAAGIGIPLAIGGSILASKPGIRADIADRFNTPGDIHQKDQAQEIPATVMSQAQRAHEALSAHGIDPTGLRIAVDAPSGAGKTVLSKALAQQMGLRHHGLDWRPNLRFHQLTGGGDIEKTPYAPHAGEILEHQQLLRSYDPELFDVAIHIHKDPATIKQQLLKRGRGARTHDLLDYDKSIAVGRKAFETLGGEAIDLGGGAIMKVRPREGWGNQLDQQLATSGIDPTGLTRHQKLLSLHSGKREEHGAGWTPYMKSPFTGGETAAIAGSIPLGIMAAKALAHR